MEAFTWKHTWKFFKKHIKFREHACKNLAKLACNLKKTSMSSDETSLTATNSYKGHSQLTPPGHSCRGEEYPKGRRRRRRGEGKVRPGVEGGLNSKDQDSDDHRTHSSSNSSDCQSCSADENEPLTFPFIGQ